MKKLRLARQIVRNLDSAQLGVAKGGGPQVPTPPVYVSQINAFCLVSKLESCQNCLTPD